MRLLVVANNEHQAQDIRSELSKHGIKCDVALSAQGAARFATDYYGKYDGAIIDCLISMYSNGVVAYNNARIFLNRYPDLKVAILRSDEQRHDELLREARSQHENPENIIDIYRYDSSVVAWSWISKFVAALQSE